jgi:hypothetical protein
VKASDLLPWALSGNLTGTRTVGEVGFNKNGSALDIWIRIDGKPRWFAVQREALLLFLASSESEGRLDATSDGNAEDWLRLSREARYP